MEQFLSEHHSALYGLIYFGTFGGLALWEGMAPRRPLSAPLGIRWSGNLGCLFINFILLWWIYGGWVVDGVITASAFHWGLLQQVELPYWIEVVVALLLLDLGQYGIHRAFHAIPVMWRMHRMHHSDQDYDFTTGSRFHPFEAIVEHGGSLIAIILIGPPAFAVLLSVLIDVLTNFWVHSNIRMPRGWDRRIRRLLVTPDMHRIHHSRIEHETNSNFGSQLSLWDRLFGSYVSEPEGGHEAMAIGLTEYADERHIRLDWMLRNPVL